MTRLWDEGRLPAEKLISARQPLSELIVDTMNSYLLERLPNHPVWQTQQNFAAESGCAT